MFCVNITPTQWLHWETHFCMGISGETSNHAQGLYALSRPYTRSGQHSYFTNAPPTHTIGYSPIPWLYKLQKCWESDWTKPVTWLQKCIWLARQSILSFIAMRWAFDWSHDQDVARKHGFFKVAIWRLHIEQNILVATTRIHFQQAFTERHYRNYSLGEFACLLPPLKLA